jgi:hypothetical protein
LVVLTGRRFGLLFIVSGDFLRFYLRARTNFLQTSNNHAIAIFQTFGDQPFVANRLVAVI